jgi:hypothetical protein
MADDGRLIVSSVTVAEHGWLVVHAQRDGQVGDVLGYTELTPGLNEDVVVVIDPLQAVPAMVAIIHVDDGEAGRFDFPGPDVPVQHESTVVSTSFNVELEFATPAISIADQDVGEDGLIRVENVYSPGQGWLLIHADDDGSIGPVLGFALIRVGFNNDLTIPIRWREGTPKLYAVLYKDEGRPGRLDEALDMPLLVSGEPVVAPFSVNLPPDVFVLDQPVVGGEIIIERVLSSGPAWLVIYFDDDGIIGRIIGYAPLDDGLNELVRIPVVEEAVTPLLHILVHEDSEPGDEFNFPAMDRPITYEGRLPLPHTFRTNPGNYLITRNQSLEIGDQGDVSAITIPLVVVDAPTWIVIRAEAEEEAGDIIGSTWLPAGINRNVRVEVDQERVTDTLYAVLHLDAGIAEQFDFPDGEDIPLRRNRNVIQSPFSLLP